MSLETDVVKIDATRFAWRVFAGGVIIASGIARDNFTANNLASEALHSVTRLMICKPSN